MTEKSLLYINFSYSVFQTLIFIFLRKSRNKRPKKFSKNKNTKKFSKEQNCKKNQKIRKYTKNISQNFIKAKKNYFFLNSKILKSTIIKQRDDVLYLKVLEMKHSSKLQFSCPMIQNKEYTFIFLLTESTQNKHDNM